MKGTPDSPYAGGESHGRLLFPPEYPMKPPSVFMLTPSGRFEVNTRASSRARAARSTRAAEARAQRTGAGLQSRAPRAQSAGLGTRRVAEL